MDLAALPFIQARNYTKGRRAPISLLVIHDMEATRGDRTALHVSQWFAGPDAPHASAHFCLDSKEIVQSVQIADTAWAAPGANDQGIHFELAGFAHDSTGVWLADAVELELAATLVGQLAVERGIPIVFLDAAALLRGESGITTHAEVSKAWKKSDHSDPGSAFPMAEFIQLAQAFAPKS